MAEHARYILVAAHPQGDVVSFPCANNRLDLITLRSHFNQASGLKYLKGNHWIAVTLHDNKWFSLPAETEKDSLFIVVSGAIDTSRQILNKPSFQDLKSVFNLRSGKKPIPTSRKDVRLHYRNKKTSKTYKVVFIQQSSLPVAFSRQLIVKEGFVTIDSTDSVELIFTKLNDVLKNTDIEFTKLQILTYMAKTLSDPVMASDFHWNAETIKANVGQGRLYVMLEGYQITSQNDSYVTDDDLPEISRSSAFTYQEETNPRKPASNHNFSVQLNELPDIPNGEIDFMHTDSPRPLRSAQQLVTSASQPSMSAPQISPSALQTSSSAPQPSSSALQTSSSAPQPSSSAPQPSSSALQTLSSAPQPSSSALQTLSSAPQPSSSALQPVTSFPQSPLCCSTSQPSLSAILDTSHSPANNQTSELSSRNTPLSLSSSSSDEFLFTAADTPTVQFRRQNLSLRRNSHGQVGRTETIENTTSEAANHLDDIEILDSEDEELQRALFDSFEPDIGRNSDINEIISKFQEETVDENNLTKLLVMRSNVLETAIKGLDRKALDLRARLYVKFSGEIGEDQGGPRREFFRLVMKGLHQSRYFEGPENSKIFTHAMPLLEKGHYRLIGRLVGLSLAQDGPGLHFLSSDLFDIMVGKETQLVEVENLMPENAITMIRELREADNFCKEDLFLATYGDQLLDIGISNVYRMARGEKENLIQMIMKHYIYYRISAEIFQFISGMNDVNKAWDLVIAHADSFKPLFCYEPKAITGDDFLKLCKYNYSEQGSNSRNTEDTTVFGFESFLQSIEDGDANATFSELLVFITGADHIPPCGFTKKIDIDFYTCDGRLPSASTCALQLWLPRVTDPDKITALMVTALKESSGFLKI